MKHSSLMAIGLTTLLVTSPVLASDDESWWDSFTTYVSDIWSDTEDERETVADTSKELAEKTKELGADIAEETADVSKKVYEDGKEVGSELWEKSKKTGSDLWEKTKETVDEMKD
ncbi:hypothetical protein [Catenovulum agarivorans]|uniref:hypothetical protein n=1 Tax=Catenovulum agarivorans TaxID=1172192 RepID=UPI0002E7D1E7|nr:hypothetical protein [Catenovulum agarivorans]